MMSEQAVINHRNCRHRLLRWPSIASCPLNQPVPRWRIRESTGPPTTTGNVFFYRPSPFRFVFCMQSCRGWPDGSPFVARQAGWSGRFFPPVPGIPGPPPEKMRMIRWISYIIEW